MNLEQFFHHVLGLTDPVDLPFHIEERECKKGEVITAYGQVESNAYFIKEGIAEMTIKSYTSEKVIDFFFPNEMALALSSFLTQQPADVQIVAFQPCQLEFITYSNLQHAYATSLHANKFGRLLMEYAYLHKAKREKEFLTKTAEERYEDLINTHHQYVAQLPVSKIAKYLGIHPESLSRIRKKFNS